MADFDSLYHRLFSHPLMVEQLVRDFVPEAMAAGLDFSRMRRVNAKFHGRRGKRREGDVIWCLPTGEGGEIYLYLLFEFQSQSDWWMAVRAQVYEGLLWQHIVVERKLKTGDRLPPVLLLTLYNGEQRWTAPTAVADLIALPPDSPLWPFQPQVRYHVLDMGGFPGDELVRRESLAALLFRLEQRHEPDELVGLIDEVIDWFRHHSGYAELKALFTELVRQAIEGLGAPVAVPDDLVEMKTMLATQGKEWKQQWKAEGIAEGETKGKAETLLRLLCRRFDTLPPGVEARVPHHPSVFGDRGLTSRIGV
ncbi:MAG: Rpn family recombination-promoting nuclease/putative transposase, partial [Rhodospirillaceae bacterium]